MKAHIFPLISICLISLVSADFFIPHIGPQNPDLIFIDIQQKQPFYAVSHIYTIHQLQLSSSELFFTKLQNHPTLRDIQKIRVLDETKMVVAEKTRGYLKYPKFSILDISKEEEMILVNEKHLGPTKGDIESLDVSKFKASSKSIINIGIHYIGSWIFNLETSKFEQGFLTELEPEHVAKDILFFEELNQSVFGYFAVVEYNIKTALSNLTLRKLETLSVLEKSRRLKIISEGGIIPKPELTTLFDTPRNDIVSLHYYQNTNDLGEETFLLAQHSQVSLVQIKDFKEFVSVDFYQVPENHKILSCTILNDSKIFGLLTQDSSNSSKFKKMLIFLMYFEGELHHLNSHQITHQFGNEIRFDSKTNKLISFIKGTHPKEEPVVVTLSNLFCKGFLEDIPDNCIPINKIILQHREDVKRIQLDQK